MKTIFKKQIILQLEKGKSARHIIFNIELRETKPARDWETCEMIPAPIELSITGATRLGGCACQKLTEILSYSDRVKPQEKPLFNFICDIWQKYHLNTLKAGTKKQENYLFKRSAELLYVSNYETACEVLKEAGIYNDRGIEYGRGWYVEQIPADIIALIKELSILERI